MKRSLMIKPLAISLLISLGVGALSGFLTRNSMEVYQTYAKPPLAPPGWVFAVVWPILYVLMGISAYLVYREKGSAARKPALLVYAAQLVVNFVWPFLFFTFEMFLPAFFWLLLLIALIVWMIMLFYMARPLAAALQVPYLLWTIFAAYLNLGILLLNR